MIANFNLQRRNYGHWDVYDKTGRLFRIRGGPGKYLVSDERKDAVRTWRDFKTLLACMVYICDDLMFELIVADGQKPTVIESWNVK